MSSSVSNDVLAMFATLQSESDQARIDTGSIPRPHDGEWPQIVRDIQFETNGVTIKGADGQQYPAWKATVHYQALPGGHPEDPLNLQWPGKPCVYPTGGVDKMPGPTEKGSKAQARMNLGRFKGILKAILGSSYSDNLAADVQAAQGKIANRAQPTAILVNCKRDKVTKGTGSEASTTVYFQEYGVRNLSATA